MPCPDPECDLWPKMPFNQPQRDRLLQVYLLVFLPMLRGDDHEIGSALLLAGLISAAGAFGGIGSRAAGYDIPGNHNCSRGRRPAELKEQTGHKLILKTGLSSELIHRIEAGEPFDVFGAPPPALDRMIKAGKLRADTRMLLVRSDVGVGVKAGAAKPDIRTRTRSSRCC